MTKLFGFITLLIVMQITGSVAANDSTNNVVIAVIVDNNQKVKDLKFNKRNLNLIYLRKQRYWPKGLPIKPVNLISEHPLRLVFSQSILGSLPKAQIDYWNGQYFNGVLPPYSVESEEAVLRYVAQTKGAIGYVSACRIDKRVKALLWIVNKHISVNAPKQLFCQDNTRLP